MSQGNLAIRYHALGEPLNDSSITSPSPGCICCPGGTGNKVLTTTFIRHGPRNQHRPHPRLEERMEEGVGDTIELKSPRNSLLNASTIAPRSWVDLSLDKMYRWWQHSRKHTEERQNNSVGLRERENRPEAVPFFGLHSIVDFKTKG
jgi:hypothetical protein